MKQVKVETAHRAGMGRSLFWKKVSKEGSGASSGVFLHGGEGEGTC